MGAASSITYDKLIMRVVHDEIARPLDGSDIDTPRGETAKAEVRRLRGMFASRTLGEDAAAELKKYFDQFDADESGEIDAEELGALIAKLGLTRTKSELKQMVAKVDDDGSGEISFEEFCSLLGVKVQGPEDLIDIEIGMDKPYGTVMFSQRENRFFYLEGDIDDLIAAAELRAANNSLDEETLAAFQNAFKEFDHDGGGTIDTSELSDLMESLGMAKSREELEEMVLAVDEDGSGEIDFAEFCVMMATKLLEEKGKKKKKKKKNFFFGVFFKH